MKAIIVRGVAGGISVRGGPGLGGAASEFQKGFQRLSRGEELHGEVLRCIDETESCDTIARGHGQTGAGFEAGWISQRATRTKGGES